jgi:hypothetical protein
MKLIKLETEVKSKNKKSPNTPKNNLQYNGIEIRVHFVKQDE